MYTTSLGTGVLLEAKVARGFRDSQPARCRHGVGPFREAAPRPEKWHDFARRKQQQRSLNQSAVLRTV